MSSSKSIRQNKVIVRPRKGKLCRGSCLLARGHISSSLIIPHSSHRPSVSLLDFDARVTLRKTARSPSPLPDVRTSHPTRGHAIQPFSVRAQAHSGKRNKPLRTSLRCGRLQARSTRKRKPNQKKVKEKRELPGRKEVYRCWHTAP